MKWRNALLVKLALQGIPLLIMLPWLYHATIGRAVLTAAVLWLGSFLIGDLGVLRWWGQEAAAVADLVLIGLGVMLLLGGGMHWRLLAVELVVTLEEVLYHQWLVARGLVRG